MRDEKVSTRRFGDMDAYLIEARSIGGLSGSPVFVHLGIARIREGGRLVTAKTQEGVFYWMGLVHGHYDYGRDLTHADGAVQDTERQPERINMGIAIVVPADRILEIFEEPKLKQFEKEAAEARIQATNPADQQQSS
jgi:hypothetical protein